MVIINKSTFNFPRRVTCVLDISILNLGMDIIYPHKCCLSPLLIVNENPPNRRYLHLDEGTLYRVIALAHLDDPECYAGGSAPTVRVYLAGQDEGERSDEEIPWSSRLGVENSNTRKNIIELKTIHGHQ
jgi:hypothetical protein